MLTGGDAENESSVFKKVSNGSEGFRTASKAGGGVFRAGWPTGGVMVLVSIPANRIQRVSGGDGRLDAEVTDGTGVEIVEDL